MANPLSMYVPIKQDKNSQAAAQKAAKDFVAGVTKGLNESQIVHYAKLVLIPNPSGKGTLAIFLSTEFDGAMLPYLKTFWDDPRTQLAFQVVANLALTPPKPPVTDLNSFANFIDKTNLSQPSDLYQAYKKTVKQINAASK